jgi:uncharacterized coiled-coil protein SlyX
MTEPERNLDELRECITYVRLQIDQAVAHIDNLSSALRALEVLALAAARATRDKQEKEGGVA